MGYIVVDEIGNIISYTDDPNPNAIAINNDAICHEIRDHITDYKFLNETIVHQPRPTLYHAWDGEAWVFSQKLKTDAQEFMWEKIKVFRDSRRYKGIKINVSGQDYWIHSDPPSRTQHLALLGMAILHIFRAFFGITQLPYFPDNLMWKTMGSNNLGEPIWVQMTWLVALQIFAADTLLEAGCFTSAEYHRAAMLLTNDPFNYDYSDGWPAIFPELEGPL